MRVLIVGVGSIGKRHLRCFAQTNRALLSICEVDERLRAEFAGAQYIHTAVASVDEVLADPPDAAVICTPADRHLPIAQRLAEAGVHLLIEKPLGTSRAGVEQLRTVSRQKDLVVAVAYVQRMHPVLSEMRQAFQSGRFGKTVQVVAVSGQHFPYYRPAYREIYYRDRGTGGGAVQDALTHLINAGEWLVGPLTEVAADVEHQVLTGVEVEDTVHVIGRHGSVQASYSLNQHQAANEGILTLVAERGMARFEMHRHRWGWVTAPDEPWQNGPAEALERDDLFVRQANMFLDAVERRSPVACSLDEAEQTLCAGLAVLKAAETKTWQAVPLDGGTRS